MCTDTHTHTHTHRHIVAQLDLRAGGASTSRHTIHYPLPPFSLLGCSEGTHYGLGGFQLTAGTFHSLTSFSVHQDMRFTRCMCTDHSKCCLSKEFLRQNKIIFRNQALLRLYICSILLLPRIDFQKELVFKFYI